MLKYFFRDVYSVEARLIPAVITFIPIGVLSWLLMVANHQMFADSIRNIITNHFNLVGKLILLLVILFSWSQVVRISSKFIESIVFRNELLFPTTTIILHSDSTFPDSIKRRLHSQISQQFGIHLLSQKEEMTQPTEARKLISIAVKKMRDKIGAGRTVLQYNILYGFVRNTTIGSVYSFVGSIIVLVAGFGDKYSSLMFDIGIFMTIFYLIILLLAKHLWRYTGILYATTLINEYLEV